MKSLFIVLAFLIIPYYMIAQKDGSFNIMFKERNLAQGQIKEEKRVGEWLFFSFDGDTLIKGSYKNNQKEGKWEYYDNGKKISELFYKNGLRDSIWVGYFKTGELAFKKRYKQDLLEGKTISYFKTGIVRQERFYSKNSLDSIRTYKLNGTLVQKGSVLNGVKQGEWYYKTSSGKDSLVSYNSSDSIKFIQHNAEVLFLDGKYIVVERMPEFPGGKKELIQYLRSNITHLKKTIRGKNRGLVKVKFEINKTGEPTNIEIEKSVSSMADKEALRIIKKMPNWIPGLQSGIPVNVSFVFPLRFE